MTSSFLPFPVLHAGFAAIMASTYKAYLGEGLGPLEWIKQFQIPHPGRVIGRAVLHLTMPAVLDWVLGGNNDHLARARPSACRVEDRLKVCALTQHISLAWHVCYCCASTYGSAPGMQSA